MAIWLTLCGIVQYGAAVFAVAAAASDIQLILAAICFAGGSVAFGLARVVELLDGK